MADKQSPLRAKLAEVSGQAERATRSVLIPEAGRDAIGGVVELATELVGAVEVLTAEIAALKAKRK